MSSTFARARFTFLVASAGATFAALAGLAALAAPRRVEALDVPAIAPGSAYIQTNLASDVPGLASLVDPQLINPWGVAVRGISPFWTANNGTSTSSLLLVVPATDATTLNPSLPHVNIPGGLPTGVVGNATSDFQIGGPPAAASFLFASITGNITAWSSASGTTAQNAVSLPGHVWTGLALAN
ncbi:MAG TPA: hypothetical protein VGQ76_00080, partial [Thermoanaerobaculia bacterium]|nr:hypothetical protein [Thermoanaerobaculia bacterium]